MHANKLYICLSPPLLPSYKYRFVNVGGNTQDF